MKREADLERRLRSLETLHEAVSAMKSLSAHHLREARAAVEAAHRYREGIERIVMSTDVPVVTGEGPCGLLVVGGDLGLCGTYNADVVSVALAHRERAGSGPTFCVGHRVGTMLANRGVEIVDRFHSPASVHGIPDLLLALGERLLAEYMNARLSGFDVVANHFGGVGAARPRVARILPPSRARGSSSPAASVRYVRRETLVSTALREFLYATLYDILLDALAAEHGARLVATQSAERWLEDRTRRLGRIVAALRREGSTQEMLEIASGARARRERGYRH